MRVASSNVLRTKPTSWFLARGLTKRCLHSTVNADEIAHFSKLSSQWWDERGEFSILHRMNPTRVQYIVAKLREVEEEEGKLDTHTEGKILKGLDVLDIGCGGGLLSESLARLGAHTLGVDASRSNITIASLHASSDPYLSSDASRLEYRYATSEQLAEEPKRFDIVCSMEVVEHVDNPASFIRSCCDLVKPGGHLFLSTIARTPAAYFLTIFMAEKILGSVSPGTHTYNKFINPYELVRFFQDDVGWFKGYPGRMEAEVRGIIYLPWSGKWVLAYRGQWGSTECNYMFWGRKPLSE